MQGPPHRGARQVDNPGDIAERQLTPVAVEDLHDAQTARQRFQEFRPGAVGETLLGWRSLHTRHPCDPPIAGAAGAILAPCGGSW